ncbi:MAG: class I adenylate-forming enzyme family protein [Egibacteraceae bacterium]
MRRSYVAPDGLAVERQPWLGAQSLSYPERLPTVVHVLDQAARRFGEREAFVDGGASVTYAGFAELVEGAVERLEADGVHPGDRIAVAMHNSLDLAVALFACARGGFVLAGLNVRLRPTQWAYMLSHSKAALALAQPEYLEGLAKAGADAGMDPSRIRPVSDVLTGRRRPWRGIRNAPDESSTFQIVYTSGTTGRPKGSQIVHRASIHSATSYAHVLGLTPDDRTAVLFQLSYVSALHAHVLPMMLVGGACVLIPEASASRFVRILREQRVTWAYAVPSMWIMALREPTFCSPDLDHLRLLAFGGSPFPRSALPALRERLPKTRLHDVYGLSETHSPATILLHEEMDAKPGSVGRPLPCMEARVVDDDGHELPAGQPGELLLRGSLVTPGYLDDPAATGEAIVDGWLHTGDIARIDADGYVWILDRKKDMITRGGHKIYSVEVEQLLLAHPAIIDAAVVGVPDPIAFEAVACFVVPADGHTLTVRDVQRWVGDHMADYAVPRRVVITDHIPRNRTGKIPKTQLRDHLTHGQAS